MVLQRGRKVARYSAQQSMAGASCAAGTMRLVPRTAGAALASSLALGIMAHAKQRCRHSSAVLNASSEDQHSSNSSSSLYSSNLPHLSGQTTSSNSQISSGHPPTKSFHLSPVASKTQACHRSGCLLPTLTDPAFYFSCKEPTGFAGRLSRAGENKLLKRELGISSSPRSPKNYMYQSLAHSSHPPCCPITLRPPLAHCLQTALRPATPPQTAPRCGLPAPPARFFGH